MRQDANKGAQDHDEERRGWWRGWEKKEKKAKQCVSEKAEKLGDQDSGRGGEGSFDFMLLRVCCLFGDRNWGSTVPWELLQRHVRTVYQNQSLSHLSLLMKLPATLVCIWRFVSASVAVRCAVDKRGIFTFLTERCIHFKPDVEYVLRSMNARFVLWGKKLNQRLSIDTEFKINQETLHIYKVQPLSSVASFKTTRI